MIGVCLLDWIGTSACLLANILATVDVDVGGSGLVDLSSEGPLPGRNLSVNE